MRLLLSLALAGLTLTLARGASAQAEGAPAPQAYEADDDIEPTEPQGPAAPRPVPPTPARETVCTGGADEDGDGMIDCADADCFQHRACMIGASEERNDEACSDWVDNDGDGMVDCEDSDCTGPGLTVCHGSASTHQVTPPDDGEEDLPELEGSMSAEDLIGAHGDADGERNDYTCSDGIDNDNDGRTDCQDFGCRFDPQVTVCTASPGYRFSVVAGVGFGYDLEADTNFRNAADVNFTRLQIRALGQIPFIENSFFLLSTRWDTSPRLTFAHFQVPIGANGHYLALNSGSGNLSVGRIISTAKQPLLDPPFYMLNAFEQGNGAALETGGPLTQNGRLQYRAYLAGGIGLFTGNVGGRRTEGSGASTNFAYSAGAQLQVNVVGFFNRFDSHLLYNRVPATFGFLIGGKWDQRPVERYPAAHASIIFRYSIFAFRVENYWKMVLDYGNTHQDGWNAEAVVLLVPKRLALAADIGGFWSQDFTEALPDGFQQPLDTLQWRVALHFWWYRNIGLLSLLYREQHIEDIPGRDDDQTLEREIRLEAQFRF